MNEILLEVSLILVLILLNGFFAATEMAVVSARKSRLQALAGDGHRGARRVLALQQDPGRLLSTVQIGITLVATLASAVGGASVVRFLEPRLAALPLPWPPIYAEIVALLLVVTVISYLTLVLGELMPKELALRRAVALSTTLSGPLDRLSRLARPLVWLLSRSSDLVLHPILRLVELLLPAQEAEDKITDEEIMAMLREGVAAGAFHPSEQTLVQGIFRFADRSVREIMKPRTDITAVATDTSLAQVLTLARQWGYTRYPVYEGDLDQIVGVVHIKELLLRGDNLHQTVRQVARKPLLVPGSLHLIEMLRKFQKAGTPLAIVLDEFGGTAGLVTLNDLLEEMIGGIEDEYSHPEPRPKRYSDGRLAVPGALSAYDLAEMLGVALPEKAPYETVAGLILYSLGHIPQPGEEMVYQGYRLIVQEMEARKISQVMIIPLPHRVGGEHPDRTKANV
jgi:putative hemolysin